MSRPPDEIRGLQRAIGQGGTKLFDVAPYVLRTVLKEQIWARCVDRKDMPFPTFEAFVTHPLVLGAGMHHCRSPALLQERAGRAATHQGGGQAAADAR